MGRRRKASAPGAPVSADLARLARRIADDPGAPIADRVHAIDILHRLRHGLPLTGRDRWRLRVAHGIRRREARALARMYGVAS